MIFCVLTNWIIVVEWSHKVNHNNSIEKKSRLQADFTESFQLLKGNNEAVVEHGL